ncbi:hypothetical protein MYVALT_G_00200 [Candidatus Vallotia tarda]|uniref:Uncharacterized protein n=1 Tax=Candidatus Vallotiella hemipterorum TaxID=1177213 RepID=A0A916NGP7_9BURK|nr:hypothetical protein MYVALT_G_00200 [Candidatus Vallotia tarda]
MKLSTGMECFYTQAIANMQVFSADPLNIRLRTQYALAIELAAVCWTCPWFLIPTRTGWLLS